jgi:hypothetical protein
MPLFALLKQHLQLDQKVEQTCAALAVKSRLNKKLLKMKCNG